MSLLAKHVLLRHRDVPDIRNVDVYMAHGGYDALRKDARTFRADRAEDVALRTEEVADETYMQLASGTKLCCLDYMSGGEILAMV